MSAALECLHRQYPGKFQTDVDTSCNAIYENNPHVTKLDNAEPLKMEYPLIHQSNQRPVHFIQGYVDYLADKLGVKLTCTVNRPFLYLSDQEKAWTNQVEESTGYKGKFWLVCSGTKTDFTVKGWPYYQRVIDHYRGRVQFVQVGSKEHNHKPLDGAIDLLAKTDTRQLIRLAYHASGILCGESFLHHLAAAFQKPCVCVASGMTPRSWQAYNTEAYLTMQGRLPCCMAGGCWKSKVTGGKNACELPVFNVAAEPYPRCMTLISPDQVITAMESYYAGGLVSL
jgi:ADP-heptose:LPS heptosyltransferase